MNALIQTKRNGITVFTQGGKNTNAWVDNGLAAWWLSPEEQKMDANELVDIIDVKWKNGKGIYRCSSCAVEMPRDQIAGRYLFAGIACPIHWQAHLDEIEKEKREGAVCRMCGKVYSCCCC